MQAKRGRRGYPEQTNVEGRGCGRCENLETQHRKEIVIHLGPEYGRKKERETLKDAETVTLVFQKKTQKRRKEKREKGRSVRSQEGRQLRVIGPQGY